MKPPPILTPRERDVLRLIARGYDNRAIALQLGLSGGAVEKHSNRIFRKLALRSQGGRNARVLAALRFHDIPLEATGDSPA